jgi:DNA-binding IclR family transcriptional regulator
MGVSEIAHTIRSPPGTAFRGLDALHQAGLLARQPSTGRSVPGPTALALRQTLLSQFPIRDACLPYLRRLASMSGETASLHVRLGWYVARIVSAPGTAEVTNDATAGTQLLSVGHHGRAILAHLGGKNIARYRAWAKARQADLPGTLERELAAIRQRGVAEDVSRATGGGGFALPICHQGQAFAAVGLEAGMGSAPKQDWAEVVQSIEALVRANPALASQPFQHLNPDDIILTS